MRGSVLLYLFEELFDIRAIKGLFTLAPRLSEQCSRRVGTFVPDTEHNIRCRVLVKLNCASP